MPAFGPIVEVGLGPTALDDLPSDVCGLVIGFLGLGDALLCKVLSQEWDERLHDILEWSLTDMHVIRRLVSWLTLLICLLLCR